MSYVSQWVSPELLRPLGLALLHFLWQGAAISALAAIILALCQRPQARYAVALAALAAMTLAPMITLVTVRSERMADGATPAIANSAGPELHAVTGNHAVGAAVEETRGLSANSLALLVQAWFAGVLLLSVRTAGGLLVITRMRRREAEALPEKLLAMCVRLQERLELRRVIRYCGSARLDAPAVAGWLRPVVFLPATALTGLSEAQLATVIAHELAHIRRLDGLVNLLQIAAETLLFYHPGVWWISRRIREEREHCCDDVAISVCGNAVEYARALTLMEEWRTAPAMAMAANGSPLAARIARLLGITRTRGGLRSAGTAAGVLCLAAALLAGNALFGHAKEPTGGPWAWQGSRPAAEQETRPDDRDAAIVVTATRAKEQEKAKPKSAPSPAPGPATAPQESPAPTPTGSYIDQMKAAGLETLNADELVGLKVQDVTPEYVRGMKELGIPAKADDLIGMKVQGITPDYVREMRAATGQQLNGDELIGLKVQGVTAEYVKQLRELGLKTDADDVVGMKVQGVTPAYVRDLRGLGLQADSDDIIGMKVQGITPEYVKSMHELGLKPSADDLVGMKVQGITAAYLKEMQAAGFKLDIDDAIGAKVQGVTPAFIAKARSYGFKDLTLEQIIRLKQSGVLDKQGEK